MSPLDCQVIAKEYADWLRGEIIPAETDGICRVATPFLDRHRNYVELFIENRPDGLVHATDDGNTMRELMAEGVEFDTERRMEALERVRQTYEVNLDGDELNVSATNGDIGERINALVQAILAVGALVELRPTRVESMFLEDVRSLFTKSKINATPNVRFKGASGLTHHFNFVLPRTEQTPERLIGVISTPNRQSIEHAMFSWGDARSEREAGTRAYSILNDLLPVNQRYIAALRSYEIRPVVWRTIEDHIAEFQQ